MLQQKKYIDDNLPPAPTTYNIGDEHEGGIIFYLEDNQEHGLVIFKDEDEVTNQGLVETRNISPFSIENGIYKGRINQEFTIDQNRRNLSGGNSLGGAFKVCYDKGEGWYLPSTYELYIFFREVDINSDFAAKFPAIDNSVPRLWASNLSSTLKNNEPPNTDPGVLNLNGYDNTDGGNTGDFNTDYPGLAEMIPTLKGQTVGPDQFTHVYISKSNFPTDENNVRCVKRF